MSRVLAIGDTHSPFAHPHALDFLRDLKRRYKPDVVVHIGDLGDQYGWSRHDPSPDAMSGGFEVEACRKWCRSLYKLFPCVLACIGNHDARLVRNAQRARIPTALIRSIPEIYDCPDGWEWADDHTIDGVRYFHGERCATAEPAVWAVRSCGSSCVIGHYHMAGGVKVLQHRWGRLFGMSLGCLVDRNSPALAYAAPNIRCPALGSGVIIDGVPTWIPMEG